MEGRTEPLHEFHPFHQELGAYLQKVSVREGESRQLPLNIVPVHSHPTGESVSQDGPATTRASEELDSQYCVPYCTFSSTLRGGWVRELLVDLFGNRVSCQIFV